MPVLLYQLWAFVSPGPDPDRAQGRPAVDPDGARLLRARRGIAYVVLPFAISFLFSFTDDTAVAAAAAGPYFDFVTTMFLAFGLVMEFPILLVGLSRVGIVTLEAAARRRAAS